MSSPSRPAPSVLSGPAIWWALLAVTIVGWLASVWQRVDTYSENGDMPSVFWVLIAALPVVALVLLVLAVRAGRRARGARS